MPYNQNEIRQIVRRVVLRTLGNTPGVVLAQTERPPQEIVTAEDLSQIESGATIHVSEEALVTPLARQVAMERRITLTSTVSDTLSENPPSESAHVVAIGCDHGGFEMKEHLRAYLNELGYNTLDCGTHSKESVDYPDFAYAVARQVADGNAFRGIIIDGAGIGSGMAANKVPGVRAAMCYDQATAVNSREHNNANVLTLGAGLIGNNLAQQIVKTWLETDFGGGRHARRVNKIMEIERRYLKGK
jgi:ribose 5-phosphate isomerase B